MKELFEKNFIKGLLFLLISCLLYCNDERKREKINANEEISIAKIISKGRRNRIGYKFQYNGNWVTGSGSGGSNSEVGEYYRVNFDKTNLKNSEIIIREKSINPMILITNGPEINGIVEKIGYPSKTYLDLYISYEYNKEMYEFRTREHIDSLPCGTVSDCENATIKIQISDYFPELNNLYFESYDRSKLRQKIKRKFE